MMSPPAGSDPRPVEPPAAQGGPAGSIAAQASRSTDARPWQPTPQEKPCPAVGCLHEAKIKADFLVPFDEAKAARFTLCREEACVDGRLPIDAVRPLLAGEYVGFRLADPEFEGQVIDFRLMSDGLIGVHLELAWQPKNGAVSERYRVNLTLAGGRTRRLVETNLTYTAQYNECWYTTCLTAHTDLRGQPPLDSADDAGTLDDAGGGL